MMAVIGQVVMWALILFLTFSLGMVIGRELGVEEEAKRHNYFRNKYMKGLYK